MKKKSTAGIVGAIRNGTSQTISYLLNFIAHAPSPDQLAVLVLLLLLLLGAAL